MKALFKVIENDLKVLGIDKTELNKIKLKNNKKDIIKYFFHIDDLINEYDKIKLEEFLKKNNWGV